MKAQFVKQGNTLDFRSETDVKAGDIAVINELVAVSRYDVKAGEVGTLAVAPAPIFSIEKGASLAFAWGTPVFWDKANAKAATATGPGIVRLGLCVAESLASDMHVLVRLSG